MFNLNKLVAGTSIALTALTAATAFGMTDQQELADAVSWGFENELTSYETVDAFMPYNTLTREQGAKFFSAFATLNLCKEADTTASCEFSDLGQADSSLAEYATLACQLGLFKGKDGKFMPKAPFMKNEVITVLMRALDGMQEEGVSPWWKNYYMAAKEAGITKEPTAEGLAKVVTRGEAIVLMYRAKSDEACEETGIDDILGGLFGDTTTGTVVATGVVATGTTVVAPTSNGGLKCMLASDSPVGATVPAGVTVKVATYECEATTDAVTLDNLSFARQGIADNASVKSLSVFANDTLVSKGRSFNTDSTMFSSLSPKVTIAAGAKVKLNVVAEFGAAANNQRVKIALTDFASNGKNDKSALPAVSNQFEIVQVVPAKATVKSVGSVPNVKLGEKAVKVGKFDIRNDSTDNVDLTINQITLRDDDSNVAKDLANLVLKNRGVTLATVATPGSKSVTFVLSTPVMIKRGQTETFDLTADIIDGAGQTINLMIDNNVYVLGSDSRYGYGIMVDTSAYGSQQFAITAGKVTLTKIANPIRKLRSNKKDVVLANFNLVNNAGSDNLSLENIAFDSNTAVSSATYFQNVKMKVTLPNGSSSTYNLDNPTNTRYSAKDLGVYLPATTSNVNIQLIADVAQTITTYPSFAYSIAYSSTNSSLLKIIENNTNKSVNDIVPSSLTFDTLSFINSTLGINTKSLSNVSVVKGSSNVEAIRFDLLTDEVSPVRIETMIIGGNAEFNSNRVSRVALYRGTYPNGTLVKDYSSFGGSSITLDGLNIEVPAKSTQPMYVTIDTVNTASVNPIQAVVSNVTAKDAENNDTLVVNGYTTVATARQVVTTSAGNLTATMIVGSDAKVSKNKVIVAGTESPEVAAFELNLSNDSALLKNIRLNVTNGAGFDAIIDDAMLYAVSATGGLVLVDGHAEQITTGTVAFNNIDTNLPVGTTKMYVKVLTKRIGNNGAVEPTTPYTLALGGVDVEFTADGSAYSAPVPATTSKSFAIRAVKISNVAMTPGSSAGPSSTDRRVAGITFTADASNNTTAGGFSLKAKIAMLNITFGGNIASAVTAVTLKDSAGTTVATCTAPAANKSTCTSVAGSPALVDQSGTNSFYVHVDTSAATTAYTNNTDNLNISISNLDTDVTVDSSDSNGTTITAGTAGLFLSTSTGPSVTVTE